MMQVKTLMKALAMDIDEVEWYNNDQEWNLISRMEPKTLVEEYGDRKVKRFAIYEDQNNFVTLELVM